MLLIVVQASGSSAFYNVNIMCDQNKSAPFDIKVYTPLSCLCSLALTLKDTEKYGSAHKHTLVDTQTQTHMHACTYTHTHTHKQAPMEKL